MIIPDVNLLLYAHFSGFAEHAQAKNWWERTLSSGEEVGLPMVAIFGFVRIATNPRLFDKAMTVAQATNTANGWLAGPRVRVLVPGSRHLEIAFKLLTQLGAAANLTTDAQIAALAIEYQAEVFSNDSDFARFAGLRWQNPLA